MADTESSATQSTASALVNVTFAGYSWPVVFEFMIAQAIKVETLRFCMEPMIPPDWVEVSEPEMEKAFKTLDHRQNCFGFYYERHNCKQFAIQKGGKWLGSPKYFNPA